MTIGVLKNKTLVAVAKEITEGVPVDPSTGTDFIQVLEGITNDPAKELVERAVITPLKGKIQPRTSTKSASGSLPVEWKSSGTEGAGDLETDVLYESMLGGKRIVGLRDSIEATSTVSNLLITSHSYNKGDFLHILEAGAHHLCFVKEVVDVDNITITPPMPSVPTDGTEIAKSVVYYASDDEPTFTETIYWGDEIKEQVEGCRIASSSFDSITTGATPAATMSTQALNFTEIDGSAPVVPVYNDVLPPIALRAVVSMGSGCMAMDEASFAVENTISNLTSVCSESGIIASRISQRAVTGSITPYLDDADTSNFDKFVENENFEITITLANPSGVDGEFELGSAVGAFMPQCVFTALPKADKDGTLTQAGEFQAHTGSTGTETELFLGFA